ncbi:hypothetical protein BIW11_02641 [Tropilaelaps mercedesae]|uniref:Uncharacterized protein n=1 Tax=Tropilaelaps mercedesae TaxID=418985 RepID=A0A1V9XZP7_9ACAR|nr:hypothetical protein BIW11_02641 [Tropilaelaps mercedesae]
MASRHPLKNAVLDRAKRRSTKVCHSEVVQCTDENLVDVFGSLNKPITIFYPWIKRNPWRYRLCYVPNRLSDNAYMRDVTTVTIMAKTPKSITVLGVCLDSCLKRTECWRRSSFSVSEQDNSWRGCGEPRSLKKCRLGRGQLPVDTGTR